MNEECDLACDLTNTALQETASNHRNLMFETRANGQQAHQLVRSASGIMHTRIDPIEAASVELITGGQQSGV